MTKRSENNNARKRKGVGLKKAQVQQITRTKYKSLTRMMFIYFHGRNLNTTSDILVLTFKLA